MLVTPASAVLLSTRQVNTQWLRLLSLFMRVSPMCRLAAPRPSSASTSSTAPTTPGLFFKKMHTTLKPLVDSE